MDTDIIQTQEEINFIENRLKQIYYFQDKNLKYQLLYKGTKNGDKALNFHTLVDGIKNTLTLVQSKKGIIHIYYIYKNERRKNEVQKYSSI